jgi:ketosteroid isomerase-like protein
MKALTTLLVVGMFLTTVAMADDVDDVKAATLEHFAAVNSGDADEYIKYYLPEFSVFSGGGLLSRRTSLV